MDLTCELRYRGYQANAGLIGNNRRVVEFHLDLDRLHLDDLTFIVVRSSFVDRMQTKCTFPEGYARAGWTPERQRQRKASLIAE